MHTDKSKVGFSKKYGDNFDKIDWSRYDRDRSKVQAESKDTDGL